MRYYRFQHFHVANLWAHLYKTYPYTETGSGVDTVISITDGDETIVLRANPRIF